MRKTTFPVIIVILCSMFFVSGCSDKITETETHTEALKTQTEIATTQTEITAIQTEITTTQTKVTTTRTEMNKEKEAFCRVLCVEDSEIFIWTEYIGYVCVKNIDTALVIRPLQTVVIQFSDSDLISANGEFTDCFGEEQTYLYILENPQSVRHTTAGEPTFG